MQLHSMAFHPATPEHRPAVIAERGSTGDGIRGLRLQYPMCGAGRLLNRHLAFFDRQVLET